MVLNLDRINNDFITNCEGYTTTFVSSIWHLNNYKNLSIDDSISNSEYELLQTWVFTHMKEINGSQNIFSKYCPICTSRNVMKDNEDLFVCNTCNSKYTFKTNNTLWFIDVRR